MNKETENSKLFQDFPAISRQEWEDKIHVDLKGADYEKKLVWKTSDGFKIKPYYRAEDLENINHINTLPGEYPFVRGNNSENNDWEIRQDIEVKNISSANKIALKTIDKGVEAIGFKIKNFDDAKQMSLLLKGINLEKTPIHFVSALSYPKLMKLFCDEVNRQKADASKIKGSFNFDPISYFVHKNKFNKTKDKDFEELAILFKEISEKLPNFKIININGQDFHDAGASIVQEIAFTLASANEYLANLTTNNLSVDDIVPKMQFTFAVGSNYFMEIAKLRATRLLWSKIVEQYKPKNKDNSKISIHVLTSIWNKSIYDHYVNLLRTTTEAMSGIIGGCDSLTVLPFDITYKDSDEISRRIARNQQIILKEESFFDKVADPSAGSYYIENLTDLIAKNSWELFKKVEELGGFIKAIDFIKEKIEKSCLQKDEDIAKRKINILGTNQYPNLNENMLDSMKESPKEDKRSLKKYRGAEAYENLRLATEKFEKLNGKKPSVFLFTMGNLAMRKARATFATNFFGCAGYEIIDNPGFKTIEDGIETAIKSESEIVVICSSDKEYAEIVPPISKALKEKNKNIKLIVAGYPKEIIENLTKAGVDDFIHVRTNVLECLQKYHNLLGIKF